MNDEAWPTPAPRAWATPSRDAYDLPATPHSILVVADRIPAYRGYARTYPRIVTLLLSHFSAQTTWTFADRLTDSDVARAGAVVYVGDNGAEPTPPRALAALRGARRLVLIQYHLADLRAAGVAFKHVGGTGAYAALPPHTALTYHGMVGGIQLTTSRG